MRWMEQIRDKCSCYRPGSSGAVYLKTTVVHHDRLQFRMWQIDSAYWHEGRSASVVTKVLFYTVFTPHVHHETSTDTLSLNMYFVMVQSHTTLQYGQSGDSFRLIGLELAKTCRLIVLCFCVWLLSWNTYWLIPQRGWIALRFLNILTRKILAFFASFN
jgi:hypothetical protein